ncbi:MAG: TIGR00159 family protein [Elusimicrobia bacterium RIFOXYA2_FULL_50_26]|nr:MAG: TIGR00159 family protein [Elusimicrobia bacterium RIFOXYA2_FULL_50_26]OGS22365.1 MAG: TIGR00159 family protein [Elusimicrobia bacterium RIFOXYB2_FULL_50_12]
MQFIYSLWSHYLVHIVDIFIVSYILYRLILLVKGTRAVQILLGILTLVALTFLAREVLHLRTLSWLLERFWLAAVIILAVAFQPEIRSALAQLGSHRWGKILVPSELGFVDEIIEAIRRLKEGKIGALVVLEQDTGLRSQIETGTIVNAQVTWELLLSIFNSRSPIHDGAVIIENARLIAAGCVLPLSHEQGISKVLGTRHRAALGLSEISDAIIIVVSEESGAVTLAREGRLETGIDPDELRRRLMDLYRERGENAILRRV